MSPDANLTCPRRACHGEYEYVGEVGGSNAFECEECGDSLSQGALEAFVDDDSTVGQLVRGLLGGGVDA